MNDFNLLHPVVFADLKVGDKLESEQGVKAVVAYMSPDFVVLRHTDGTESTIFDSYLERTFRFQPLCWVEEKPVYPGDGPLYYKDDPAWRHNEEGVFATSVRDDELHFHDGIAFPIPDATWAKPEQKREPSFQVEGQDVFPGDTVYYYGVNNNEWGSAHTVKENARVAQQCTDSVVSVNSYVRGAASFRLKPMLLIGDHLVPMPVRDAAEMKNGDYYYIPSPVLRDGYAKYVWSNHSFDFEVYDKGLVHRTKEAAIAHTGAFIALSKKKD